MLLSVPRVCTAFASRCFSVAAPQSGTHSHLAFATLPLPILSVAFLKLTASSRPSAPPSGSPKCLRFGHRLTLRTLNIHLLTYLLSVQLSICLCVIFVGSGDCSMHIPAFTGCNWSSTHTVAYSLLLPVYR